MTTQNVCNVSKDRYKNPKNSSRPRSSLRISDKHEGKVCFKTLKKTTRKPKHHKEESGKKDSKGMKRIKSQILKKNDSFK